MSEAVPPPPREERATKQSRGFFLNVGIWDDERRDCFTNENTSSQWRYHFVMLNSIQHPTTPSCWTCFSILPLRHAELDSASQVLNTRLW